MSGSAGTAKTTLASQFLRRRLPPRRTSAAVPVRGVARAVPAEHAVDRPAARALDAERPAEDPRRPPDAVRPRVPPRDDAPRSAASDNPSVVVVDPLSSFTGGTFDEVNGMVMRLIDFLKGTQHHRPVHAPYSWQWPRRRHRSRRLVPDGHLDPAAERSAGQNGGRHLSILKSRGMSHSSEERRSFELTDDGPRARRSPRGRAGGPDERSRGAATTNGSCGSTSPARPRRSAAALQNLEAICEEHLAGRYRIEVIDLLKQPQLARGDQIVAVPTLVRHLPPPMKKIIGDLSNRNACWSDSTCGRRPPPGTA